MRGLLIASSRRRRGCQSARQIRGVIGHRIALERQTSKCCCVEETSAVLARLRLMALAGEQRRLADGEAAAGDKQPLRASGISSVTAVSLARRCVPRRRRHHQAAS